ncbi:Fur family transcriptional regulator [Corynebacterium terpenotabidum]|uniref:Fur DNA-binding transcription regulator n=1 Tax=Corynebacterium terpenotabidum Y-11 TaxID=1200352 RepID=S4XLA8_9CORY|nr:transcriptional repressor [Corynebacterium terpenotabidum]AGP31378.1 Fur DNA-binding transcription regulator [Corynebacterium terpenotabidum Y-11]
MRTEPTDTWATRVREAGLRATPGRVVTLRFLDSHPHSTTAQVHAGICTELPTISLQSVHNVVNDLSVCGLLRRIDLPGTGGARYETDHADNHHHIQCVACGRLEDVECAIGAAPCLTPSPVDGMSTILSAEITFRALCDDCARTRAHSTAPAVAAPSSRLTTGTTTRSDLHD